MTRFRFSKSLGWLVLTALAACGDTTPPAAPFTFNRPERVEFVCIDAAGVVLPLRCCATNTPLNTTLFFEKDERDEVCGDGSPALHALVTQSTRGEVAAVDLDEREVLDSDPRIPGYTFVDVGGLPRAIVTPPHMPGNEELGPPWTYVAGAEEQSLRAVATCHFREGASCGPEAGRMADEFVLALPAPPRDMLFGPDNALWLTLPDVSALARIELPTKGEAPFASRDIEFFQLPVVPDAEPAELVTEPDYVSACGLGYTLALKANELALPATPAAPGLGVAAPTRIRFDADSGLMFVADAKQPFIHVLSIETQGVQVRAQIATGAPIRDFALTRAVPKSAEAPLAFAGADSAPAFGPDENRYLYAIDDRDGSVMVHSFAYADGKVTSAPLRTPGSLWRSDRLDLTEAATAIDIADNRDLNGLRPATADMGDDMGEDAAPAFVCDWGQDEALDSQSDEAEEQLEDAESELSDAQEAYDAAGTPKPAALEQALADKQTAYDEKVAEYTALRAKRGILDAAGPTSLRGVFVMITTLSGRLDVFDVHDLDIYCRGERWCASEVDLIEEDDDARAVAVRRHAHRLSTIADPDLTPADPDLFAAVECEAAQYPTATTTTATEVPPNPAPAAPGDSSGGAADGGTGGGDASGGASAGAPGAESEATLLCVARDPWLQTTPQFAGSWEGGIVGGLRGHLDADGQLQGPPGFDFCGRGLLGAGLEPGYEGDQVVITGAPPSYAPADCNVPEEGSEPHLKIIKSFANRLEVAEDGGGSPAEIVRCHPDVIQFEVRARDAYMVLPNSGLPPHRITADADGACVVDSDKDARLISRARRGTTFRNAFVSFELPAGTPNEEPAQGSVIQMQATRGNAPFATFVYSGPSATTPSLPVSVRYLSVTGDLYVVDTAQGLRRFTLAPFAADTTPFR